MISKRTIMLYMIQMVHKSIAELMYLMKSQCVCSSFRGMSNAAQGEPAIIMRLWVVDANKICLALGTEAENERTNIFRSLNIILHFILSFVFVRWAQNIVYVRSFSFVAIDDIVHISWIIFSSNYSHFHGVLSTIAGDNHFFYEYSEPKCYKNTSIIHIFYH